MTRTVSATEARIHFGELMNEVVEHKQPILVEKNGKPQMVMLAIEEYQRMAAQQHQSGEWEAQLDELHAQIRVELGDQRIRHAAEVIREAREGRNEQFSDLY
ncbi:MAG: type II toxin-antitoxin system Phd/YefM family antitoxin [Caldilineaceae bacterium]|nr:type II toxin-antitoxin system Phd/YefM family antitoxin [Caldilineaceae bacterium]